jgi:hypothetical protein
MKQEAFLYEWFDKTKNMFYIGVHKGTVDDGYVCSCKIMLEEFKKRPEDFERKILKFGIFSNLIQEETQLLKEVNAAKNINYYNQHNGDGNFYCKFHNEETKQKIKEKLKAHIRTKEHSKAISESKKGIIPKATYLRRNYVGENNPNFGKKWPEQSKIKHEMFSKKYIVEGQEYLGLSEVMIKYNLKSKTAVFYRIKSKSSKFKDWNYGN